MGSDLSTCAKPKKKRKSAASRKDAGDFDIRDSSNVQRSPAFGRDARLRKLYFHTIPREPAPPPRLAAPRGRDGADNSLRRSEPPRPVMWGLYEPQCPGRDWDRRVQKERVRAIEYGRAKWNNCTSLPHYLRQYLHDSSPAGDEPDFVQRSGRRPRSPPHSAPPRAFPSEGHENFGYFSDSPRASMLIEGRSDVPPQSRAAPHGAYPKVAHLPPTVQPECDSAFRAASSGDASPRSPLPHDVDKMVMTSPSMTDKSTQCEALEDTQSRRVDQRLSPIPQEEQMDRYTDLQKSLDILLTAVAELDDFAAAMVEQSNLPPSPATKEPEPPQASEATQTCDDRPPESKAFEAGQAEPAIPEPPPSETNNNVGDVPAGESVRPEVEETHIAPVAAPMVRALKARAPSSITSSLASSQFFDLPDIKEVEETDNCSERSQSENRPRSSRSAGGANSVHYRLRIPASASNLDLFKVTSLTPSTGPKTLLQIAKDSCCQLHLLPRKDYSAGFPKRTLLIRAPSKRCIKVCLKEMSKHYPSLVTIC